VLHWALLPHTGAQAAPGKPAWAFQTGAVPTLGYRSRLNGYALLLFRGPRPTLFKRRRRAGSAWASAFSGSLTDGADRRNQTGLNALLAAWPFSSAGLCWVWRVAQPCKPTGFAGLAMAPAHGQEPRLNAFNTSAFPARPQRPYPAVQLNGKPASLDHPLSQLNRRCLERNGATASDWPWN